MNIDLTTGEVQFDAEEDDRLDEYENDDTFSDLLDVSERNKPERDFEDDDDQAELPVRQPNKKKANNFPPFLIYSKDDATHPINIKFREKNTFNVLTDRDSESSLSSPGEEEDDEEVRALDDRQDSFDSSYSAHVDPNTVFLAEEKEAKPDSGLRAAEKQSRKDVLSDMALNLVTRGTLKNIGNSVQLVEGVLKTLTHIDESENGVEEDYALVYSNVYDISEDIVQNSKMFETFEIHESFHVFLTECINANFLAVKQCLEFYSLHQHSKDKLMYLWNDNLDRNLLHRLADLSEEQFNENHYKICELLLAQREIMLNDSDLSGWTPLHYAVRSKNTELVMLFLENGADHNQKDEFDMTPLQWASIYSFAALQKAFQTKITVRVEVELQSEEGLFPSPTELNEVKLSWNSCDSDNFRCYYFIQLLAFTTIRDELTEQGIVTICDGHKLSSKEDCFVWTPAAESLKLLPLDSLVCFRVLLDDNPSIHGDSELIPLFRARQ